MAQEDNQSQDTVATPLPKLRAGEAGRAGRRLGVRLPHCPRQSSPRLATLPPLARPKAPALKPKLSCGMNISGPQRTRHLRALL